MENQCQLHPSIVTSYENLKNNLSEQENFKNSIFCSNTPAVCEKEPCRLGIDEAGRGPVLGPMVYGACYCPIEKENDLKALECADSKALTPEKREQIFNKLCEVNDYVGWMVEVISPNSICNSMLQRQKYSLNQVSHDSAIGLIERALNSGVNIVEVYVDTVGMPEKYQDKLSKIFPQLKITVAKKADSLYTVVSAASICAKVTRDLAIENWKFSEGIQLPTESSWGSGYPNDPVTKVFLESNIDQVFGFPQLVRFSWSTAEKILNENAATVEWEDIEEELPNSNASITSFFKSSKKTVHNKHQFFTDRCLVSTETL
uniref:Ribonuclease n=1 Tax=Clastoptera arizonana TaxID=38151 RepID=A0A1B6DU10_9HEMI